MKNFAVILLVLLGVCQTPAQVTVELLFDQEMFLPHEQITARVRVANSSGQTIRLGEAPDWLQFMIETEDKAYAKELRSPDVVGAFTLESSHTATKRVELSKAYDLSDYGRYKVTATVKVPAFQQIYTGPAKTITITRGTKIWNTTFGVPAAFNGGGEGQPPEVRQYHLVQSNLKDELRLYARVTDALENVIRIVPIGALVSFSRPEPQVDQWSNLHILYQNGARNFSYTVINPEGQMIAKETHLNTDTRPALAVTDEGRIFVKGGLRKVTREDLPPPMESEIVPDNAVATARAVDPTAIPLEGTNNITANNAAEKPKKKSSDAKEKKKR